MEDIVHNIGGEEHDEIPSHYFVEVVIIMNQGCWIYINTNISTN